MPLDEHRPITSQTCKTDTPTFSTATVKLQVIRKRLCVDFCPGISMFISRINWLHLITTSELVCHFTSYYVPQEALFCFFSTTSMFEWSLNMDDLSDNIERNKIMDDHRVKCSHMISRIRGVAWHILHVFVTRAAADPPYVDQIWRDDIVMWTSCLRAAVDGKGGRWGGGLNYRPTLGCRQEGMSG